MGSDQDLMRYLQGLAKKNRRESAGDPSQTVYDTASEPAPMAASKIEESVTNTQHAGVDEGGIVKVHGNHLVVLRRGRLFTSGG